jgi:hypothetical protein
LAVGLAGCFEKKEKEDPASTKPDAERLGFKAEDTTFQAFLGRLRKAAAKRDMTTLASMMTPDFGYRWDTPPANENVFAYWDQNDVWKELDPVLRSTFVPHQVGNGDAYMVAPPPSAQQGWRAGIRLVNGAWRFAYFVPPPPN